MRTSNQCSMALHALLLLSVFPDKRPTSEEIAKSVGCNPVMIRNLLGKLKAAGLVTTRRGAGGSALAKSPEEITLWAVYQAVDRDSLDNLIGLHPHPYPQCPIGKAIHPVLEQPYQSIKAAVRQSMESATLQQLLDEYRSRSQMETDASLPKNEIPSWPH